MILRFSLFTCVMISKFVTNFKIHRETLQILMSELVPKEIDFSLYFFHCSKRGLNLSQDYDAVVQLMILLLDST